MKLRILFIGILLLIAALPGFAQGWTASLEWGYTGTIVSSHDYQYTTLEGYHIDNRDTDFRYHSNGYAGIQFGRDFKNGMNLSFCTGLYGIQYEIRSVPFGLRASWAFRRQADMAGWAGLVEAGIGLSDYDFRKNCEYARIGAMYRIPLGAGVRLRFLTALQGSHTHPVPYNPYDDVAVDADHLEYSNRIYAGLTVGIGLEF